MQKFKKYELMSDIANSVEIPIVLPRFMYLDVDFILIEKCLFFIKENIK